MTYDLRQSPLFRLRSKSRLSGLLGVGKAELRRLAKTKSLYTEWDREGLGGKSRHIESPLPELARVQKRVAQLLSRIALPDFVYCPARGKSYVTNAR